VVLVGSGPELIFVCVRLKVWSPFTIVYAAAQASRSLLHFGVVYGPDGAAGNY